MSNHKLTLCAILLVGGLARSAFAQIVFQDVTNSAGFATSGSETWGAVWGDIDGDHYPDIFSNNHRTRAALYRNNRNGTFTDVSQTVDLSKTPGWTGGSPNADKHGDVWADVDNDGDDDLLISVSTQVNHLLINDKGRLTDRTVQYGVDKMDDSATRQNLFFDYNGDGLLDLAKVSLRRPAFHLQLPNGTFGVGPVVEQSMACSTDAQWAHLADTNPAPGLEFVCSPRTGSYPKINAFAGGLATNVTGAFPQYGPVNDATTLDYNRDLRPDFVVVRRSERPSDAYQSSPTHFEAQFITAVNKYKSVTFKTTGVLTISASLRAGSDPQGEPANIDIGSTNWSPTSLTFQLDKGNPLNAGIGTKSPGINIGYLTATGDWKIVQGNSLDDYNYSYVQVTSTTPITNLVFTGQSASDIGYVPVLLNNTISGFVSATNSGLNAVLRCQSVVTGDFDNDMDEDIYFACTGGSNNIANRLYANNGNGTFTEVANAGGAAGLTGAAVADHAGTSDSVIVADYDLDGFLDLFVTNGNNMRPIYIGGPKQLFHNVGNANHWIELDLVGTVSNRDGIGSEVFITSGGVTQYREQNGGYHRWSQNFKRIHAGLGGNTTADITVQWANGASTVHMRLQANHVYQLKQDGTATIIK